MEKSVLKKRILSLGLCLLLIGQGVIQNTFISLAETDIAVYMTTTPENRVGDTINLNYANVNLTTNFLSDTNVTWYRSIGSDYNGEVISDATGNNYQLTENDVGYHVYAEVSVANSEMIYVTGISKVVKNGDITDEEKMWSVEGDWEYSVRGDETAEIRLKRKASDGSDFKLGSRMSVANVEIPSSIAGLKVTKIADDCFLNCYELYSKTHYSTVHVTNIPSTVKEIGSGFIKYLYSYGDYSSKFVIPETVLSVEADSVTRGASYAYNDGISYSPSIYKLTFENPTIHINGGMMQTARNLISSDSGLVTYSGAAGSTAENMYINELRAWSDADLASPDNDVYKWEKSGIYTPDGGLILTPEEQLQRKLDNNQKNYITSTDRLDLDKDIIDGTDKLVVKPNEVIDNLFIIIPPELDNQIVGALELDTTGKKNVVVEVSDGVIIDSNSKVDSSTIISGNSGSQAEEFAKENNLIFENKDSEIASKEEADAAKRSQEITSSDGYWKYSFIDGYNGVEIQNIKSFGVDATVEVPEMIDGHKTSVFKGNRPKQADVKYASIVLPEGIHVVNGDIKSAHSYDLGYSKGTTNLTVMDKFADVSSLTKSYAPATIIGWRGSTAEAICIPMENNIGSTFIALDDIGEIFIEIINTSGIVGSELESDLKPSNATGVYQWQMSDTLGGVYSDISGASSSTYIPVLDDVGKYIKVKFTGSETYVGKTVYSKSLKILSEAPKTVGSVKLSTNEANTGISISATAYANDMSDITDKVNWQWYRFTRQAHTDSYYDDVGKIPVGATLIDGATSKNYMPTVDDVDYYLYAYAYGNNEDVLGSNISSTTKTTKKRITGIEIIGDMVVGSELQVYISPDTFGKESEVSWLINESQFSSRGWTEVGTGSTYVIKEADVGKFIKAQLVNFDSTYISSDVLKITGVASVKINIEKTGNTLTASLNIPDATGVYQWQISDTENSSYIDISGASSSTYISTSDDVNKFIKVVFTGSGDYVGQIVYSNVIQIVGGGDSDSTPSENQCNVEVTQGQSFVVKIPAFVSLEGEKGKINSASFVTGLTADIAGTDSVTIKPSSDVVVMKESGGIKKDIEAIITMNRIEFGFDNYTQTDFETGIEEIHSIEVKKLTAGKWTGTINWIIETKGEVIPDSVEHVEYKSYQSTVDGLVEVK